MSTSREHLTDVGRLLIQGADRPGILSNVTSLLSKFGANIVSLDQYSTDPEGGRYFQRTEFHLPGLGSQIEDLLAAIGETARELEMDWTLIEAKERKRVALFVSKFDHCLLDLLWRARRGSLDIDISMVISNHPDLSADVRQFGIPFVHVPVPTGGKAEAERRHLELLKGNVDFIVLARYMQILSPGFLTEVGVPVINIHHSFLPAFIGASPYQKAKDRGVKLIGATAHYVTEDLDEGPIIEQDVLRVAHSHTAEDLATRGADVERLVLAKAVDWHSEDRILRDGNTTVIFRR
ncbi:formyltetrahydrofolate deformylase [Sinomonas sp. ASV486]|uniref:formyltetrahydrofolate deformylase n=1 Tax=Sinomonas sp. ASV486 TaxID=3051170 RepID=UPI0027DBE676|nr:formyltetrahydrofolate deformylase [Sinomonas sp. ASV486]MDQ4490814.1 formyltetrahydrofolate deformylase [Sinomonas sp. ASV486]